MVAVGNNFALQLHQILDLKVIDKITWNIIWMGFYWENLGKELYSISKLEYEPRSNSSSQDSQVNSKKKIYTREYKIELNCCILGMLKSYSLKHTISIENWLRHRSFLGTNASRSWCSCYFAAIMRTRRTYCRSRTPRRTRSSHHARNF